MEFRVLGPLEVRREGRTVDLRGRKRRAVLALLVLHANEVVRTDRLIDELWGEGLPANASAALHNHVSRLRKDLGGDVLVTRPWGYVLRTGPGTVDLQRFESLVTEAKPLAAHERRAKLAEALALWRGPALADLDNEPSLTVEIARLEELRLSVIEQRTDADLELGKHEELVPELEALIGEHPLRERLRGQLILALYRSGRQAEALETYRETRRVLVEELGIEPSPELRELERSILRQDPGLASASPPPEPLEEKPPASGWRWPRSPLVLGAGLLLLAGVGTAIGLLATKSAPPLPAPAAAAGGTLATHRTSSRNAGSTSTPAPASKRPGKHAAAKPHAKRATHVVSLHARRRTHRAPAHPSTVTTSVRRKAKPSKATGPRMVYWLAEDFHDAAFDHGLWHIASHGTGVGVAERNERLEFSIAPDAVGDGVYGFDRHYGTNCLVKGDFDAVVEFELLTWPAANGVKVTLGAYFPPPAENFLAVNRSGGQANGGSEVYESNLVARAGALTDDAAGKLRLRRRNGVLSGYYRYRKRWVKFGSTFAAAPTNLILSFNSPGGPAFGGGAAAAAFDNFEATAASVECNGVPLPPRRRPR